jgi:esterase/lipase superfamily enzyme
MNVTDETWHSPALGRDMQLKVYGHSGKPVIVFPSSGGRFFEYEDFGMVEACRGFVEAGKIALVTVDSVDAQSWHNEEVTPAERARRHQDFDRYITGEVVPFVRARFPHGGGLLATGCSMGAYHAANFFFRHPDVFDAVIALSGVYRLDSFVGDFVNDDVYFNAPLLYLPGLTDPWYLERYRRSQLIFCVGQGAWEDEMLEDTRALERILEAKRVPAWFDYWGHDVNHDWPWWRKQMPYFLERLELP